MPEAMSAATTGLPASFTASITSAVASRIFPLKPVPKMPSITTSVKRRRTTFKRSNARGVSIAKISSPMLEQISRCKAVAGVKCAKLPTRKIFTFAPPFRKCRADANASPPLLPLPATMQTFLPSSVPSIFSVSVAITRAAFSMSKISGTPKRSKLSRSMACISLTDAIFIQSTSNTQSADA